MKDEYPQLAVRVTEMGDSLIPRDDVVAVPTFMLNERVLSLGNPDPGRLRRVIESFLEEHGFLYTGAMSTPGRLTASAASAPASRTSKLPLADKACYLSATAVFQDLNPGEIEELDRVTARTTCRQGKVFYTPGETGEVLFILKRGRVNLYRINPDGKKLITATIEPGSVFGEMSLVGQGMYDSFAEAAEDCTLCVMSRSDIEHLITTKPQVGLRFMEVMAGRLRDVETRLENVAFKSVPARLAASLLELAQGGERRVTGLSHQDLADMVGTYRETTTRILNEFRNEGHIDLGRMNITILQPDALRSIAEG